MRAPLSTSASLTRPVPALVILNVVRPASSLIAAGLQPASVSLISTVRGSEAAAVPDAVGVLVPVLPPQPARTTTHRSSTQAMLATCAWRTRGGASTYN